jgi:dihydroneopterin triphosphate diphosphatase
MSSFALNEAKGRVLAAWETDGQVYFAGIDAASGVLLRWNVAYTFEIYLHWRHRFAPGVTHNTEHVFGLGLPGPAPVTIAREEHIGFGWMPWREAAEKCFSWSNRDAICMLGEKTSL